MIQCYVSCWDKVHFNVRNIEKSFKNENMDYLILNSSKIKKNEPRWHNLDEDQWYFFQIYEALKDFRQKESEYMVYICGDVWLKDFANYIKEIEGILKNNKKIGVLSPYYTYESICSKKENCQIEMIDDRLGLAVSAESIILFLKKEVAEQLLTFLEYVYSINKFKNMRAGWFIDQVVCIICSESGYMVCRDNYTIVHHPNTSSYSHEEEIKQGGIFIRMFFKFYSKNENNRKKLIKKHETVFSSKSKKEKKEIFYSFSENT